MNKFYSHLKPILIAETWKEIQPNRDVLYSFPYWTLQIAGDKESASLQ